MKKKDIIQLVKDTINEVGADAYGDATLTSQGQSKSRFTKTGRPPGVMEFQQPKSFDPDTINLVRQMLSMADIHYNELVGEGGEISSFLDKRSGGTFFKFPHFNGPQGRGAMFGKETTSKINRSKSKSKSAALKTYTQFKTYIEDYEISDASPSGVYGNIYLFVMFNESAEDYTAPKGGTKSSQFEENENDGNIKFINKFNPSQKIIDMYNENPHLKKPLSSLSKFKKIQAIAQLQTHFSTSKDRDMIKKEDRFDSSLAEIIEAWADDYYKDSDFFSYGMYVDKDYFNFFNANKDLLLKKYKKQQIPYIKEAPMFKTDVKQDMAPKDMAGRIKKVFDKVNGAKDPVKTPEWHKNRFEDKYGISFPKDLKGINKDQALAMNKYANDMTIKEEEGSITTDNAAEAEKLAKKGIDVKLTDMNEENNINNEDNSYYIDQIKRDLEELDDKEANEYLENLSKAILKLKKINENMDNEGRMAKSQMYKMQGYVNKLSKMLDDGAQLPAWVQSKLTKASDYMSAVFHYLEYEAVRGQDNLNEHVDKYKKRAVLMEGAMKKFFEMFDKGMTDEEVVLDYAQRGTQIPEMFVNKARKQYEGLKKMKLELEMSEKEYKNSATQIVNNPATNEMDGSTTMETKQLASDLFNEETEIEEKLDPVGKEDDDIDNDGDVDKTDDYLKNKRKAVSKAIANKKK